MERLTIKNSDGSYSQPTDTNFHEIFNKLGELEDVLEEFELTSAEDLRNYLNFKGNMAIWEGKLELKNKIADLQYKLEVVEKALELLSKSNISNVMEEERQPLIDYIKEQAEKEVKGE